MNENKHTKETCSCLCQEIGVVTSCMGICFYNKTCPKPKNNGG